MFPFPYLFVKSSDLTFLCFAFPLVHTFFMFQSFCFLSLVTKYILFFSLPSCHQENHNDGFHTFAKIVADGHILLNTPEASSQSHPHLTSQSLPETSSQSTPTFNITIITKGIIAITPTFNITIMTRDISITPTFNITIMTRDIITTTPTFNITIMTRDIITITHTFHITSLHQGIITTTHTFNITIMTRDISQSHPHLTSQS